MAKIMAKIMAKSWQKMHASITRARVWGGVFCHALACAITANGVCLYLLVPPLVQCCSALVFLVYITLYWGKTVGVLLREKHSWLL